MIEVANRLTGILALPCSTDGLGKDRSWQIHSGGPVPPKTVSIDASTLLNQQLLPQMVPPGEKNGSTSENLKDP